MQLQITTDYAIRILGYLYERNSQLSTATEMSQQLGITYQYFMKVINRLKKAGFVESVQGCNGGYQLTGHNTDLTLYDIIVVMEGDIVLNRCLHPDQFCSRNAVPICQMHRAFHAIQEEVIRLFKEKKVVDIWKGKI